MCIGIAVVCLHDETRSRAVSVVHPSSPLVSVRTQ
jgi:hypothetical protein